MTFDVFEDEKEKAPAEGEEPADEEDKPKIPVGEKLPRTVFIKEVVREPRMHFFKVPRLGSYLAVRLEYKSCLFEEAFDSALQDYTEIRQKQKEQEEEKRSFLEKQSQDNKDKEEDPDQTIE